MAAKIQQWNHLSIMCFLHRTARFHFIHPVGLQELLHQLITTSLTCRAWLHSNNKWPTVSPGLSHWPQIFYLSGICLANNALIGSLSCRASKIWNLCLRTILLHHIRMVSLCTCWCCSNHEYPLAEQYSCVECLVMKHWKLAASDASVCKISSSTNKHQLHVCTTT